MKDLATMTQIEDLREVWKDEARDFTPWLAKDENLVLLGNAIGLDITLEETESAVGNFNVDILAKENIPNGRTVIIENQLEDTNHDHLGKIITYAAGKDADIVIWIVKTAREEHRKAIEWLNEKSDINLSFFLVEIELWKIDDSKPAPKFNVVEQPNEWGKLIKRTSDKLTRTKEIQLSFWEKFNEYAPENREFSKVFKTRKPQPQHWYDMSMGSSSYRLSLTANTRDKRISSGIYISNNMDLFDKLEQYKQDIEANIGSELTWSKGDKDCSIYMNKQFDIIESKNDWSSAYAWYCENALRFRLIMQKYK